MGAAQWIVVLILGLNFIAGAVLDGKEVKRVIDIRTSAISALLWLVLLVWGGFFDAQRCSI